VTQKLQHLLPLVLAVPIQFCTDVRNAAVADVMSNTTYEAREGTAVSNGWLGEGGEGGRRVMLERHDVVVRLKKSLVSDSEQKMACRRRSTQ
jgi:hypothetical protein